MTDERPPLDRATVEPILERIFSRLIQIDRLEAEVAALKARFDAYRHDLPAPDLSMIEQFDRWTSLRRELLEQKEALLREFELIPDAETHANVVVWRTLLVDQVQRERPVLVEMDAHLAMLEAVVERDERGD